MKPRRSNPLYSPIGCGSAVLLVLFLSVTLLLTGPSLFSPGKLSAFSSGEPVAKGVASHAEFEEECQLCHGAWIGIEPSLCLECHDEIDLDRKRDLEQEFMDVFPIQVVVTTCHTDHNGIESDMTTLISVDSSMDRLPDLALFTTRQIMRTRQYFVQTATHQADTYWIQSTASIAIRSTASALFKVTPPYLAPHV